MKSILESDKVIKCGQNIKLDYLIFKRFGINLKGIFFDTTIAGHLLYPQKSSYEIEDLALEYLDSSIEFRKEIFKSEKKQLLYQDIPIDNISNYFCNYVDALLQITNLFKNQIDSNTVKNVFYNIESPLISVLAEIENNGIYVNAELLESLSITVNKKIQRLEDKIYSICEKKFNINSPKQLAVILFDDLQLKEIKKRSTAIEVLEELVNYHPLPKIILEYRHLSKLNNTYISALPEYIDDYSGRIHTSLNQTIVATGRLSSTKPNFQNIPIRTNLGKEIRKSFQAQKEGYYILSADYSQIELRIMAHLSQEPELVKSFCEGVDIHQRTASLVFNISGNEINAEQRRIAKIVNFGIMYGAGAFRISKELGINIKAAKDLIENYFETYSGIKNYIDKLIIKASKQGYVETLFGRKRFTYNLLSSNKNIKKAEERALINMPIQGTAAELIKIAMINIQNKIDTLNLQTKMILQIHDELLFEIPKYEIDNVSEMIKFEMENAIKLDVPIKVEYDFGTSWYDAH